MGYAYFVAEKMRLGLPGVGPGMTNHKMGLGSGQKMLGKWHLAKIWTGKWD